MILFNAAVITCLTSVVSQKSYDTRSCKCLCPDITPN